MTAVTAWLVAGAVAAAVLLFGGGRDGRVLDLRRTDREDVQRGASGRLVPGGVGDGGRDAGRTVWRLRGRRRRRIASDERALEACGALVEELRAGRDAGSALRCAAAVCPELAPVVQAHDLGADVPSALRRTDVHALHRLAAAWQVSARSGSGLAETVRAVAADLRAERRTRRVVAAELASARSTARLLVALPVVALVAGSGGGTAPWQFFVGSLPGAACLVVGLTLLGAGLVWIERIAEAVEARA